MPPELRAQPLRESESIKIGLCPDPRRGWTRKALSDLSTQLLDAMKRAKKGEVVVADLGAQRFSAHELAEVLHEPLRRAGRGLAEKYLVVSDPACLNAWDADAGLRRLSELVNKTAKQKTKKTKKEKFAVVWRCPAQSPQLVGQVDPKIADTYNFVLKSTEGATARELARSKKTKIQTATNRMSRALQLGLIHRAKRYEYEQGGTYWVYVAVR